MNLKEKLSAHFTLGEFVKSASVRGHIVKPTYYQKEQMKALCEHVLEPIRKDVKDYFKLTNRRASIKITSGIRDKVIYEALKKKGYKPSRTSDHFYQSELNPIGRGAVDIFWPHLKKTKNVNPLKMIYDTFKNNYKSKLNQCIYYKNSGFIHVSLHPLFSFQNVKKSPKRFFIK